MLGMTIFSFVDRVLGNLPAWRRWRRGLWVWTPGLGRPTRWTRLRSCGRPFNQVLPSGHRMEDYGR